MEVTESIWPSSVAMQLVAARSQTLTVRSSDADASRCPSSEKATEPMDFLWPSNVATHRPVARSQTLIAPSSEADTNSPASGEKATEKLDPRF